MNRRSLLSSLLAAVVGIFAARLTGASSPPEPAKQAPIPEPLWGHFDEGGFCFTAHGTPAALLRLGTVYLTHCLPLEREAALWDMSLLAEAANGLKDPVRSLTLYAATDRHKRAVLHATECTGCVVRGPLINEAGYGQDPPVCVQWESTGGIERKYRWRNF